MKINLLLFLNSMKEGTTTNSSSEVLLKTFESSIRPMRGDILEDSGFCPDYHNGYEVAKVTINYEHNECWVSLAPLAIEIENISKDAYLSHLVKHGWQTVSIDELEMKMKK